MIREIEIEGFKSIEHLTLELGRVTVLVGENGCGKSNILEAIAFASAAYADRLDHEFLAPRGIRSTAPGSMRPAFPGRETPRTCVKLGAHDHGQVELHFEESSSPTLPRWSATVGLREPGGELVRVHHFVEEMLGLGRTISPGVRSYLERTLLPTFLEGVGRFVGGLDRFVVFSPEYSALRTFAPEGQILPLGVHGEGLFAHLRALHRSGRTDVLDEINRRLSLIGGRSGFDIAGDLGPGEQRLAIRDRHVASDVQLDQRSASEGFLFLLFCYTLSLSPDAPTFFAIDDIGASLDPRTCAQLMSDVVELAEQRDRQVIVTTYNPAVLDGLDLGDDEQRLVVVSRSPAGATRVRRVRAPEPSEGAPPLRPSEAFLRGLLGG